MRVSALAIFGGALATAVLATCGKTAHGQFPRPSTAAVEWVQTDMSNEVLLPPVESQLQPHPDGEPHLAPIVPPPQEQSMPAKDSAPTFGPPPAPVDLAPVTDSCPTCGGAAGACGCTGEYDASVLGDDTFMASGAGFDVCDSCGCMPCAGDCIGSMASRWEVFGEFLYLRPRDAQVAYAVPIDGPIAPTLGNGVQIGPAAVADINHNGGFRVGVRLLADDGSMIAGEYAHFDSHVADEAFVAAPFVLRSLVTHPLGANAATDGLRATASLDIDFDTADLAYHAVSYGGRGTRVDYVLGVRYGELEQEFDSEFATNGATWVDTDISFHGTGPLVGLRLDQPIGFRGFYVYGRGDAAFLVGKADAQYVQGDLFAGNVVDTAWESGRIVSQLGMELGIGWSTLDSRFRVSGGYLVSAWYNTVRTDEFIQSVQRNNFVGLGDGLTLDGLVVHAELRF